MGKIVAETSQFLAHCHTLGSSRLFGLAPDELLASLISLFWVVEELLSIQQRYNVFLSSFFVKLLKTPGRSVCDGGYTCHVTIRV